MNFKDIIKKRYAVKKFTGERISDEKVAELQHVIQLSASSFGLQPYTIYVVRDDSLKEKLKPAAFHQEQITTSSHLLVFCANTQVKKRIDAYENMLSDGKPLSDGAKQYIEMMRYSLEQRSEDDLINWASKQAYIALGNALNGATALGFDSCPMEGFDAKEVSAILDLPEHLTPVVLCPIGFAADTPRDKLRYPINELFVAK